MATTLNDPFDIDRNESTTEPVLWFKLDAAGKRVACSSRDAVLDFRQRTAKDDRQDHPAAVSLFQLMPKLAYSIAKKNRNPQLSEALLNELEERLIKKATEHRNAMVLSSEKLPANQRHWAHLFADYDLDGGRSPESYLYHAAQNAWLEVGWQALDDEAHMLWGTKDCKTLEDARAKVKKMLAMNAQALREGRAAKDKSMRPTTVSLDEWAEEPSENSLTNALKRLPEPDYFVNGIPTPKDVLPGQMQMKLHDFATPFRSPIRTATLAQAFNDMCDAMVGLTVQGGQRPLGRNHSEAFKAYWGVLEGKYEEFALNEPMEALVKKLPAYANADQLKDVIKAAKNLWLNPPEDEPTDTPFVLAQKKHFRALCARCWEMCLPSRITKNLSEEDIQKKVALYKQAISKKIFHSEEKKIKQPFQALRKVIHDYLNAHLIRTNS
jgi:hypothetical protein